MAVILVRLGFLREAHTPPRRPGPGRCSRTAWRRRRVDLHLGAADADGAVADHAVALLGLVARPRRPRCPAAARRSGRWAPSATPARWPRLTSGSSTAPAAPAATTSVLGRPALLARSAGTAGGRPAPAAPPGPRPGWRSQTWPARSSCRRADADLGALAGQQQGDALADRPGAAQHQRRAACQVEVPGGGADGGGGRGVGAVGVEQHRHAAGRTAAACACAPRPAASRRRRRRCRR